MAFLNALPGAVAQGLIWGLVAIGIYISYKILDIADLSVDGSFATGACICVVAIANGVPVWLSIILSFLAGAVAGAVTGLLHTALGVPSILAGILTQLSLYSINLQLIMGGRSNFPFSSIPFYTGNTDFTPDSLLLRMSDKVASIIVPLLFIAAVIVVLWLFFYTEIGLTIKSTGDNPAMSKAQGVNINLNKVIGLAISNGIVALAGALLAQYQGFADVTMGTGAIVIGLAAIFIGLSVSLKIKPNFVVSLIGVVGGSIVYYVIFTVVMLLGLHTNYLKLLSAMIVAIFLAVPYLKKEYFSKRKHQKVSVAVESESEGGDADA